jgi:hypothetical protein
MVPMGVSLICNSQSPTQASLLFAMEAEENKRVMKKKARALNILIRVYFFEYVTNFSNLIKTLKNIINNLVKF